MSHPIASPVGEDGSHLSARFVTVGDMPKHEPALTQGGLRHLIFHRGEELERTGILCRFGRKILIDLPKFREWVSQGGARNIAGSK
ncbi:hypothetical protein [Thiomonas sp. FB-Cd]|uniref:hypothetical protein n=1 Tax=Thiomonas sp. FB-Cd TaxID=1158292 RepID=UPI0004DF72AC|nr:hypothetical protein [Thiomonas sp. FB-Cd]